MNKTQKALCITALALSGLWIYLATCGLPNGTYDPDGEGFVLILTLLDALVFLLGVVSLAFSLKQKTTRWISLAILGVPVAHFLGMFMSSALDLAIIGAGLLFLWRAVRSRAQLLPSICLLLVALSRLLSNFSASEGLKFAATALVPTIVLPSVVIWRWRTIQQRAAHVRSSAA